MIHTKASILVLVSKFSSSVLYKMLDDLKPLIAVSLDLPLTSLLEVISTVIGREHEGHSTGSMEAEKSTRHALQNTCSQEVT